MRTKDLLRASAIAVATSLGLGVAAATASDADITASVKADFAAARALDGSSITVKTERGVVTLEGSASTQEAKDAATTRAKSIAGVTRVNNKLKTHAGQSPKVADATSDTWITTKVKSEILADGAARGAKVHVSTIQGTVVLGGSVPSQAAADRLKEIASKVNGVKGVNASGLKVAAP